ncbi:FAD-dependent oxidoreductase [Halorientalis pallida]|uniref:Pyridine nucleotide-disulfide oxidoreductase n=1 Tax=Halorientalis pallida TaxID=2479928 RepID=A0A498KTM3_9EURY|nr:FAD-dependent oxidoreductase [Halorientalis pallida]RXK46630.1 pyridine nucleotide-disulfide oxidoreductase [Halorientalis pallida]
MTAPVVVVGGDAAGMSAASKFKRDAPDREVVVFERGEWVSYGACGLPYYVKGAVETLEDLVSVTPEEFVEQRDIDLRTNHEVTAIDREAQTVSVDGPDGEFEQAYSELLIATGARAVEPPLDGMELDGVFTLHSMQAGADIRRAIGLETPAVDAREVASDYADTEDPESVGIIGGGYVGIEMAEAFAERGLDVHLFEMLPHTLQPFGANAAATVERHLREQGVDLHLDTAVDAITGDGRVSAIAAGDADVPVDLALVGVGVAPNTKLAEAAGIDTGETGAIATDGYGRTNDDHVYAAGDCAEATHVVTDEPDHVPLALTANRAGRAIGQTLAGDETPVGEIAGTAAVKAFDLEVARTGVIEESVAREAGFDPVSVTITAPSRAHYYPGGSEIEITMLGDRESGRVLGASMVGREGVAKRIDTVAAALHAEMTAQRLSSLDLAYAPPFSPVWDPVLTAAKVLAGKLE